MPFNIKSFIYHVSTFQVEDLGWTALSVVSMALLFVYSASAAGDPHRPPLLPIRKPPRSYLAQARQRKIAIADAIESERRRARIRESWATKGFPFQRLPPELQLMVLAFSSEWPETYRALVLVSRHTCHATLRVCIPLMPVTLSTSKQLSAFASLVQRDERVGNFVHQLWVSPLQEGDTILAYRVLRACKNVRVLACDARIIAATIANVRSTRFRHTMCRDLTLLLSRPKWENAMNTPNGLLFLRQLTHLRVLSEQTVPRELPLPHLTHLSYSPCRRPDVEDVERPWALGTQAIFPSLQQVVLTKRCGPEGHTPQKIDSRLVLLYVPRERTEMEMWCNRAGGESLWHKAAKALPVPKKPA